MTFTVSDFRSFLSQRFQLQIPSSLRYISALYLGAVIAMNTWRWIQMLSSVDVLGVAKPAMQLGRPFLLRTKRKVKCNSGAK